MFSFLKNNQFELLLFESFKRDNLSVERNKKMLEVTYAEDMTTLVDLKDFNKQVKTIEQFHTFYQNMLKEIMLFSLVMKLEDTLEFYTSVNKSVYSFEYSFEDVALAIKKDNEIIRYFSIFELYKIEESNFFCNLKDITVMEKVDIETVELLEEIMSDYYNVDSEIEKALEYMLLNL